MGLRGCAQNKKECAEAVNETLRPIRERRAALDDATIEAVLRDGAARARAVASDTMTRRPLGDGPALEPPCATSPRLVASATTSNERQGKAHRRETRTAFAVRAGQATEAHQELAHDLAPGEAEGCT